MSVEQGGRRDDLGGLLVAELGELGAHLHHQAEADGVTLPPRGPTYRKDPTGKRDGCAPVESAATTLRKALDDAATAASKRQVEMKKALTKRELMEHLDLVRGAVMIAYPMGLPEWDPVRMDLEEDEKPSDTPVGADILDAQTAQLWWAGKQMIPENKLSDHVGRNEKTKIVAKLQKKGETHLLQLGKKWKH